MLRRASIAVLIVAASSFFVVLAVISMQTAIAWKESRDFYRAHATTCWAKP